MLPGETAWLLIRIAAAGISDRNGCFGQSDVDGFFVPDLFRKINGENQL